MVIDHAFFMRLALDEAWRYQGLTYPNPAVGSAVISPVGELLAVRAHTKAGRPHAEVEAIRAAFCKLSHDPRHIETLQAMDDARDIHEYLLAHHDNLFRGCTIYVTLEPCNHHGKTPPCAGLIEGLGFERIVMGALDPHEKAAGGAKRLESAGVEVVSGVLQQACQELLLPFRRWQEGRFVLFKHAQTLNGTIDGGYITSDAGLDFVHAMRDVCDLIVIGGETVRTDRPTLDARRVGGKAPDVLIYSRGEAFDRTIPLFGVPDRRVRISDRLDAMGAYHNILIEGGGAMFEAVKGHIDLHMSIVSPVLRPGKNFAVRASERELCSYTLESDRIIWSEIL